MQTPLVINFKRAWYLRENDETIECSALTDLPTALSYLYSRYGQRELLAMVAPHIQKWIFTTYCQNQIKMDISDVSKHVVRLCINGVTLEIAASNMLLKDNQMLITSPETDFALFGSPLPQ